MPARSTRKSKSLATQSAELAMAAPQVVAHRLARMAMAGPTLSARDRKEFTLMVAEKELAFVQAWQAMTMQAVRAHQTLAISFLRSAWSPMSRARPHAARPGAQLQDAVLGILGKGMAPVHRKAVANAKRLGRTKLR